MTAPEVLLPIVWWDPRATPPDTLDPAPTALVVLPADLGAAFAVRSALRLRDLRPGVAIGVAEADGGGTAAVVRATHWWPEGRVRVGRTPG